MKTLRSLALSISIGLLAAFAALASQSCAAEAQAAAPIVFDTAEVPTIAPDAPPFTPPSAEDFLARAGLVALGVVIAIRTLRELFPAQLAPAGGATLASKRMLIGAAALFGGLAGLIGWAPAVAAGMSGQVVGGVLSGLLAFVGAGLLPPGARLDHLGRVGAQDAPAQEG